ncbi:hypothetical protein DM02DRAFT_179391 [Periconia macrospinosa]|uniref:R3H-associated N-terminal domain-containing protein n=1 Tax=Periconia macrospinosa TaxID=97972 RepID=A0A2V1E249_9PLEO|nr:hypothetical protein DM02DRAFT_179391 [Periconia macrospinosa]
MAIQSPEPSAAEAQPIDIETWTEQASAALTAVTISAPDAADATVTTTTTGLQIPLDDASTVKFSERPADASVAAKQGGHYTRQAPLLRRDSLKRREALLKGKEGSRRRTRWENDRLLNNPYAEPPQPHDWEVRPTHPVHNVPYYLAPLWDAGLKRQSAERKKAADKAKTASKTVAKKPTTPGIVPKELREKLKRSRAAKGLLMDLESEVRKFVEEWEKKEHESDKEGLPSDLDSEDDEIVFVGRGGTMSDEKSPPSSPLAASTASLVDVKNSQAKCELMLFETPAEDLGGSFGRWLVHHIGVYYGLKTWSITVGDPARREAYIGLKEQRMKTGQQLAICRPMPRPLYGLV